jgi:hypothetical protein
MTRMTCMTRRLSRPSAPAALSADKGDDLVGMAGDVGAAQRVHMAEPCDDSARFQ